MVTITFNTYGYNGFIDFIKAYAIFCVLFGHTFLWHESVGYGIWAGMQVPLFILVQTFHAYKKEKTFVDIWKILKRVFIPFVVIESIVVVISLSRSNFDYNTLIIKGLIGGGYGPGSYYPWIYLQVALLLPLLGFIFRKSSKTTVLIVFLFICEGLEILFSLIDCPDWIYRLLAVRYLFLIYLGWIWVKEGIKINWLSIALSVISLIAIIYFEYFSVDDEPWFYATNWKYHRWPCYYFVANGFTYMLYSVYTWSNKYTALKKGYVIIAASSYEIFLVQMATIFLFQYEDIPWFQNQFVKYIIWTTTVWLVSIFGGVYINRAIKKR